MPQRPKLVPADDLNDYTSFQFRGETYSVRKRFKIAKFLRLLNKEPVDAIEIALEEDSFERFLDLEMTMEDLKAFLGELSEAMSGSDLKS